MEVRKIFKAGNSIVVSLPAGMLKALNVREGDHVAVNVDREQREIVLRPVVIQKKSSVSVDFVRLVDKLIVDYEYALRRLAD